MVFINDKKFACATCIKGHRVSGCTHTDRPLFEVKKKGRPATQCQCCKDKRKSGNVHNKCICGETKGPEVILPPGHPGLDADNNPYGGPSGTSTDAEVEDEDHDMGAGGGSGGEPSSAGASASGGKGKGKGKAQAKRRETKKGRPGDMATFPNGLRDVHEMAAAAEALTDLNEDPMHRVERTVASLLNPCSCKHTGICKCCEPKRPRRSPAGSAHSRSPSSSYDRGRRDSTDNLVAIFKSRAPSPSPYGSRASSPNPSPISPSGSGSGSGGHALGHGRYSSSSTLPVPGQNPTEGVTLENSHHPAHTSRRVHKTKLYSPYSNEDSQGHRRRNSASSRRSISGSSVKSLRLRPLADLNKFLSAAINPDGSTATEINRSAVGLPGIQSFDEMARKAGVKVEPMDTDPADPSDAGGPGGSGNADGDIDMDGRDTPLAFPTQEDVVLGACTCGENCDCPGCATHSNGTGDPNGVHECGMNCRSHFDCGAEVSVPSGVISIDQLLSVAASAVPKPVRHRPLDQLAMDTSLLPPSAAFSPDAAAGLGVVDLKPLQCCNGRCQCTPGTCGCKDDCCGCCVRCACAEDAPTPTQDNPAPMAPKAESCCGGTGSARQSLNIATTPLASGSNTLTPPRFSPNSAVGMPVASVQGHTFNMSPLHSPLIQANQNHGHQHRHSLSSSSLPSPMMHPSSPGLLHPPAPGSSSGSGSGSSCCSPTGAVAAPLLQVNTTTALHSPFGSPAHSPAAEHFYRLPSPSLGASPQHGHAPMLDTGISPHDGPSSAPVHSFDPAQGLRRASSPAHVVAAMGGAQGPISGPVYGHSHSQSLSAGTGRRSTITGGTGAGASGVQRSASTGKHASKALALNQQANHAGQHMHVRPILPKPNAAAQAALLAPPNRAAGNASGSGSRPTSPGGRRRSSSSLSRAGSPIPGGAPGMAGGAGGVGMGRPSAHQHRASESAISSASANMGMGQQDMMPLPMVTTSAPGETRQEVSFDPNEENRDSSEERSDQEQQGQGDASGNDQGGAPMVPLQITPELAQMFQAWLVQNGHVRSPPQQHSQMPGQSHGQGRVSPTSMGGMDPFGPSMTAQPTNFSPTSQAPYGNAGMFGPSNIGPFGPTSGQSPLSQQAPQIPDFANFSFDSEHYAATSSQYLQQAMAELNGNMGNHGNGSAGNAGSVGMDANAAQPLDVFAAMQAQMMQNHGQQPIPFDQVQQQFMQFQAQVQPQLQLQMQGMDGLPMPLPQQMTHQQQPNVNVNEQMGYFGGVPGMMAPQMSPHGSTMGQQLERGQGQNHMQVQAQMDGMGQWQMPLQQPQEAQQQQQQGADFGGRGPGHMIDLSKPLDSADVDRIIKALQDQQNRRSQQQPQHQQQRPSSSQGLSSMPPPQVPPPRLGQPGHGHSLSHNSINQAPAGGSGAMTPSNMFGFGPNSAGPSVSGSGATSQLSSSAPHSSGMLHSHPQQQQQQQRQFGGQLVMPDQDQLLGLGMYGNPSAQGPGQLGVGVGVGAGLVGSRSGNSHGTHSHTHTPSFSISSFDSLLAPPSSSSSTSGSAMHSHSGSGRTSFTLGTEEDVFEQFILENSGEGFDLSALDLGAAGTGMDADMGLGVSSEPAKQAMQGQSTTGGQHQQQQQQRVGSGQEGAKESQGEEGMGDEALMSQYIFF